MKTILQSLPGVLLAGAMALTFCLTDDCRAQEIERVELPEPSFENALYVAPGGDNNATGTREKPFATIQKAMSELPASGKGVIALLGGSYKEEVTIRRRATDVDKGAAELLTIAAAPGEQVVFQGGEPILEWTPWNDEKGMYVVKAPDRQGLNSQSGYLDVWENTARVRYRTQFDAAGVRAYPGSVCLLDDERILVHTSDGRDPKSLDLWRNRAANGITLARENVLLRGLRFENYLGGTGARAVTISNKNSGVTIADCSFVNSVRGLNIIADGARIINCDMHDVGQGLLSNGDNTIAENCVIQSATGAFAIGALNQHERDGLRFYLPARGGKVSNCVTVGFWAGLYIKSDTAGKDALPFIIENNIFLDGIRAGAISVETAPQPLNRYIHNIMGPDQERIDPMKDKALMAATFEANYFFNGGGSNKGSNKVGPDPFVDLIAGNLKIKPTIALPPHPDSKIAAGRASAVQWSTPVTAHLKNFSIADNKTKDTVLRFTQPLAIASSEMGAIISVRLSAPAGSTLRFRKKGRKDWQTMKGSDNTLSNPSTIIGAAPVARDGKAADYGVAFSLLDGQLEKNTDYEFTIEATGKSAATIRTEPQTLRTSGGPREIFVRAGSNTANATGAAERPFAQLQAALDHALPGDTIRLEKGVYTAPALLTHGGTAQAPITIQGAGDEETILDGGKEPPVMLELRGVKNVFIRDLQVRWFGNSGIAATNSEQITIERCRFFNTGLRASETPNGSGIVLSSSPRCTISHCLFAKMEHGIRTDSSPQLKLLNNTAFRNLYDAIYLVASSKGSVITGNSFTFTGNDSITMHESDRAAFDDLTCDFNNYGALISVRSKIRPENDFKPAAHYGPQGVSKAMTRANIGGELNRFSRLDEWRKFSGLDAHSIFADPQYVDPLNGDFRLMPSSPNVLPDGKIIGASPVAKTVTQ